MKKILFLIPTLKGGGAEKVLVNLVNSMNKEKFSITVMTLFDVGENIKYLDNNIQYRSVFSRLIRGNKHWFKFFSPSTLFNFMIKDKYDVIVSYLQGPTTRIVSGCNNENIKIINWVHNEFSNIKNISSSYRSISEAKKCYEHFDSTVFVAETVKKSFKEIMPNISSNLMVLYNTLDTNKIKEKATEDITDIQFNNLDTINLISVGRFAHQKGYERLLKIISKLVHNDKLNIHLYLLGKGDLEKNYKEIILRNNIGNYVTLLGYKDNPYKYIKNSDLFVCSSYHEGYSTAVTESLVTGTPVLTTLCSGMKEIIGDNDYGVIVENTDEALYKGLRNLLKDKNKMNKLRVKTEEHGSFLDKLNTVRKVEDLINSL